MVIATHVIISAYGFWLPNDPRGSWSQFVGAWELLKFGPATTVKGRRSYAHDPHDAALRREAKKHLKYPPVRFDAAHRDAIAEGFSRACRKSNYCCYACCIGHDHAHLVLKRHERDAQIIVGHLKTEATLVLYEREIHPLAAHTGKRGGAPTPWSEGCWKSFIDNEEHVNSANAYERRHPQKEGLGLQDWEFVSDMSL